MRKSVCRPVAPLALAAIALTGCGQNEASAPATIATATDSTSTGSPAIPERAPANYSEEENGTYFYVAAVSEAERKKGIAAGKVLGFRYFGKTKDRKHQVAQVLDDGQIVSRSSCSEPCTIIKYDDGHRTAFDPGSIIGSVYQDAIAGHLNPYTQPIEPKAPTPTQIDKPSSRLLARVGDCIKTQISEISSRLDGVAGSGSAIVYANGIYGVDYSIVPEIEASSVGDPIKLCLQWVPKGCPPGDERGKVYSAANLRTGGSWSLPDASHQCGGA